MDLNDDPLADAIDEHIANHVSPRRRARRLARTLLILGPPSSGKTQTARARSSQLNADLLLMAGADLSGATEGAPVDKLEAAFTWMRHHSRIHRRPFVLLIDDVDASILEERPDQERTDNTNLLIGKLQAIANDPTLYTTDDGVPIPMLWTSNNTRYFRPALIRAGRCKIYRHALDPVRKARIIQNLLRPPTPRDRVLLNNLIEQHKAQPIAFWEQLAGDLSTSSIVEAVRRYGLDPAAIDAADRAATRFDITTLADAAKRRAAAIGGEFLSEPEEH
jgi:SpoVK/Ycf46/Vps4 family AAA+-type ATPase